MKTLLVFHFEKHESAASEYTYLLRQGPFAQATHKNQKNCRSPKPARRSPGRRFLSIRPTQVMQSFSQHAPALPIKAKSKTQK